MGKNLHGKCDLDIGGIWHIFECAALAMRVLRAAGVLVFLERVGRVVTGRGVGGWLGRMRVYLVVVVLGQPCGE